MLDLLIWAATGTVIGVLLGAIQCSQSDGPQPRYGTTAHLLVCAFIGALTISTIFVVFANSIYDSGPYSH